MIILNKILLLQHKPIKLPESSAREFNIHINANKIKSCSVKLLVGYTPIQMYDIVSDVEQYKVFIPFCNESKVVNKINEHHLDVFLALGIPPITEEYISNMRLKRPDYIHAIGKTGKIFNHIETLWKFANGPLNIENSTITECSVLFHFKSLLYSAIAGSFFNKLITQSHNAFMDEAFRRYGPPSTNTIRLSAVM